MIKSIAKFATAADLPPVLFLAGDEEFLIERDLSRLIDIGVPPEQRDFNLDKLYSPDAGARQIIEIARSFPMLAAKRMLIVKDIDKLPAADLNALVRYTEKPNPSTCLILIVRRLQLRQKALQALKRKAHFIEYKALYESQTIQWVEQELRERRRRIHRDAISLLVTQVGTNLRDLSNEIEKLLLYVADDAEISSEDVARVAGVRKEFTVWALQNALGERDAARAMAIYDRLRQGTAAQIILFQLARYFTNLLIALDYDAGTKSDAELAKVTNTHPYFVKEFHQHKRKYSLQLLENALENIRQVDYTLKTFSIDESVLIQQLFIYIVKGYPAQRLPFARKII